MQKPDIHQPNDALTASPASRPDIQHPTDADDAPLVEIELDANKTSATKPVAGSGNVRAPALPPHLKSKIKLAPSEQAGQAPAAQDLGLRHGRTSLRNMTSV